MRPVSDRAVFIATVEGGSLTRAAARLGVSLAVCSKRLAELERRLDVRLLNRTTRRQHLTEAGAVYYEHCLRVQEDIDTVESSLAGLRDTVRGRLRVAAPASFGRRHVSPFIPAFLGRYPDVALQLVLSDSVIDLVADGVDVAIRIGAPADSSMIAVTLASNRRVTCASPDYLARFGTPRTPEDLAGHRCLILSPQSVSSDVWTFETADGPRRVTVGGPLSSNHGEVLRDAAVGGLGIAVKSVWDIAEELRSGRLVTVLDDCPPSAVNLYALYHERRFVAPKVRAWIDFFRERFGPTPYWETE